MTHFCPVIKKPLLLEHWVAWLYRSLHLRTHYHRHHYHHHRHDSSSSSLSLSIITIIVIIHHHDLILTRTSSCCCSNQAMLASEETFLHNLPMTINILYYHNFSLRFQLSLILNIETWRKGLVVRHWVRRRPGQRFKFNICLLDQWDGDDAHGDV